MDYDLIVKLINNVGFPIVVSGALFWLNVTVMKQLKTAITDHTKVIDKLIQKLGD